MSCSWGTCDLAGEGTATLEDGTVASGVWRDGLLEGKGNMSRGDGGVVRGHFTKGCLGGLVTVEEESGGLLVGAYRGGVVSGGPIWLLLPSGEGAVYNEAHGGYGHLTRSGESGMILTMTLHYIQGPFHWGWSQLSLPGPEHRAARPICCSHNACCRCYL